MHAITLSACCYNLLKIDFKVLMMPGDHHRAKSEINTYTQARIDKLVEISILTQASTRLHLNSSTHQGEGLNCQCTGAEHQLSIAETVQVHLTCIDCVLHRKPCTGWILLSSSLLDWTPPHGAFDTSLHQGSQSGEGLQAKQIAPWRNSCVQAAWACCTHSCTC